MLVLILSHHTPVFAWDHDCSLFVPVMFHDCFLILLIVIGDMPMPTGIPHIFFAKQTQGKHDILSYNFVVSSNLFFFLVVWVNSFASWKLNDSTVVGGWTWVFLQRVRVYIQRIVSPIYEYPYITRVNIHKLISHFVYQITDVWWLLGFPHFWGGDF